MACIGRAHGNDVRIPSSEVSRKHCELREKDGIVTVEDLESVNGTFLNDDLITGVAVVRPGDCITVGPVAFVVEYELTPKALERLQAMDYEVVDGESGEIVLDASEEEDEEPEEQPQAKRRPKPVVKEEEDEEPPELEEIAEEPLTSLMDYDDVSWKPPEKGDLHDLLSGLDHGDESMLPRKRPAPRKKKRGRGAVEAGGRQGTKGQGRKAPAQGRGMTWSPRVVEDGGMRLFALLNGKTGPPLPERVNLASPAFKANPFLFYARLRAEAPVCRVTLPTGEIAWLITRYDDVTSVLKDERFVKNTDNALAPEQAARQPWFRKLFKPMKRNLLDQDPPVHTPPSGVRAKGVYAPADRTDALRIQALADELLNATQGQGRIDLIRDYALPLPATIIAEMLGVPVEDRHRFHRWSNALLSAVSSTWRMLWAVPNARALQAYLRKIVRQRTGPSRG